MSYFSSDLQNVDNYCDGTVRDTLTITYSARVSKTEVHNQLAIVYNKQVNTLIF